MGKYTVTYSDGEQNEMDAATAAQQLCDSIVDDPGVASGAIWYHKLPLVALGSAPPVGSKVSLHPPTNSSCCSNPVVERRCM